jgi:hypothetical protein
MDLRGHDLLVLLPRLTAGVVAVFLLRDAAWLLRGRRAWIFRGNALTVVSGWSARMSGVVALLLAIMIGLFALFWAGPADFA